MRVLVMIVLFLVVIALNSCGSKDSGGGSDNETTTTTTTVAEPLTVALKTKKDLPKCNESNESQLVYVIAEKTFYACGESEWSVVEITDDDTEETQKSILGGNFWRDETTDLTWYVKATVTPWLQVCEVETSTEMLTAGSKDQIKTALKNGIFGDVNVRVWVDGLIYVTAANPDTEVDATGGSLKAFNICLVK